MHEEKEKYCGVSRGKVRRNHIVVLRRMCHLIMPYCMVHALTDVLVLLN